MQSSANRAMRVKWLFFSEHRTVIEIARMLDTPCSVVWRMIYVEMRARPGIPRKIRIDNDLTSAKEGTP